MFTPCKHMKRDSHAMTQANWDALERAAKAAGCASWRVMLRKIATGQLGLIPLGPLRVIATVASKPVPATADPVGLWDETAGKSEPDRHWEPDPQ